MRAGICCKNRRHKKARLLPAGLFCISIGRDGRIRTSDPLHPMQVRYQAALRPEMLGRRCYQSGEHHSGFAGGMEPVLGCLVRV